MIWDSQLLMGLIDASIVLAALAVMVVFYNHRRAIRSLHLNIAVAWIVLGLSVKAVFYSGDLAIMFVLPVLTSPETAMKVMTELHLDWSWLASLIAAACIAFGLFGLLGRLLPRISVTMTHLQDELEARRRAEAALRKSEQRFRDITEASSDWFWEMDENLRFSYFSDGYRDIVGSFQDSLLGTTREERDIPGVDPDIWEAHLAALAAHRSFRDFHITRTRVDGSPVYLSINGKPIFDDAGNFLGYRGAGRDISDQVRAEEALQNAHDELEERVEQRTAELSRSEQGLANAQRIAHMGNWEWNLVTNDLHYSDEVYRIFGRSPRALGATYEAFLEAVHPEDRTLVSTAVNEAIESHEPYSIEYRIQRPDGAVRFIHGRGEVIYGDDGTPLRMNGTDQDISDRKEAEEALRESEARLRDAIESIPEGFVLYDADERFVLCNSQYRDFYPSIADMLKPGARLEDLARAAYGAGDIRGSAETVEAQIQRRLTEYRTAQGSHEQQLEDGRWLLCGERRTSAGGIACIRTDITERKRMEEALKVSVQRLRDIAEAASDWFWELDADLRYTYVSDLYEAVAGLSRDVLYGKRPDEVYPRSVNRQPELWARYFDAVNARRDFRDFTHDDFRQDGKRRVISHTGKAVFAEDGSFAGYRGTSTDITDHKQAEERFRRYFEQPLVGSAIYAPDKKWIAVNDALCDLMGYSREELMALTWPEITHPDDLEENLRLFEAALSGTGSEAYSMDKRFIRKDGGVIHTMICGECVRKPDGAPDYFILLVQDITERKRAEAEIHRLNESLEQRVEERTAELREAHAALVRQERLAALGQITATVSHELRNPLGAIRTSVAVMKRLIDDDDNALLAESAEIADRGINRCDAIISDLLDFSRIRPLSMTLLPVDQWLDALLDEYRLPEGITLRREFAAAKDIRFDSESLRRSFLNLLDNACQAMIGDANSPEQAAAAPAGGHVLTVASRVSNDRLEVVVGDTGPGIPDTIRDNIFEPLYSTKNFGVGLGLPIVNQIAKQHGGGLEVSQSKGAGAEFTLWLPINTPEPRELS